MKCKHLEGKIVEKEKTYYTELISAYLHNEASPEQIGELSEWVHQDAENKSLFEDYYRIWISGHYEAVDSLNLDKELEVFTNRIRHDKVIPIHKPKSILSKWKNHIAIAATISGIAIISVLLYLFILAPDQQTEYFAHDKNTEFVLPDGSLVVVKKGGSLMYFENSNTRQIKLMGDAYFSIVHNASLPFVVASGKARIKVLGTRFYVSNNQHSDEVNVALEEGSVAVYFDNKEEEALQLSKGESANLDPKNLRIQKTEFYNKNDVAWKTGLLIFENSNLGEVVRSINAYYGSTILLEAEILDSCQLSATFDNMKIDDVLIVLCQTLNLEQSRQSGKVILKGQGCK